MDFWFGRIKRLDGWPEFAGGWPHLKFAVDEVVSFARDIAEFSRQRAT
jgi:hypothetical protein